MLLTSAISKLANISLGYNLGLHLFDAPDMGKDLFVGRWSEILEMERLLQLESSSMSSSRETLILGGMGGIGKTQLAIAYAKESRSSYSSIFWLDAISEVAIAASLRALAYRVMPVETVNELKDAQLQTHVSSWLSEPQNTRWLLIFDNYDDPSQYDIKSYFPAATHGSIIITTRQPRSLNGAQLKVRAMSKVVDSLRILATRSQRSHVELGRGILTR